ncbi:MAG: hypothetical protein U9O66_01455 [Patescibacteria group bacterium]|nr:hypothetical protein [Patescibacteria group bacterium]
MKLIIPYSIERQLKKIGITVNNFLCFLKETPFKSKKLIEICAPLDGIKVYKAYLDNLKRAIIFCKHKKGIIYPVYVGNKNDSIAKNITVNIVRKNVEIWQIKVLKDIQDKNYKIRHY